MGCLWLYIKFKKSNVIIAGRKHMNRLMIVMYHYTRDLKHSRYPEIKGLDISLFEEQIAFLKKNFSIVTMEEVIGSMTGRDNLPEDAVLLTFDDGYIDNYTFAFPVLEEQKVQGSFFIPGKTFSTHQLLDVNKIHYILASADRKKLLADLLERMDYYRGQEYVFSSNKELYLEYAKEDRYDTKETIFIKRMLQTVLPERLRNQISSDLFEKYVGITEEQLSYELYMTEGQIRTMKRYGMFIGIHGYDHYWLGNLPKDQMQADISKALEVMDEFIDKRCWVMNYPYGSYNADVLDYIDGLGACLGLTTEVAVVDMERCRRLELPRLDCNDLPPKSENYKWV